MRRDLVKQNPDAFNPDLANSLYSLSISLSDIGLKEEALQVIREAVEMYKVLAGRYPDVFNSELANSLKVLSNRLSDLGLVEDVASVPDVGDGI